MITEALIYLLIRILRVLMEILPSYTPPEGPALGIMSAANFVLPISEVVTASSVLISFAAASLLYAGINWIINKVRGSG